MRNLIFSFVTLSLFTFLYFGVLNNTVQAGCTVGSTECNGEKCDICCTTDPCKGTKGDDVICGTDGPEEIRGGGGCDLICGFGGDDVLRGGACKDDLIGGDHDNSDPGDICRGGGDVDISTGATCEDFLQGSEKPQGDKRQCNSCNIPGTG